MHCYNFNYNLKYLASFTQGSDSYVFAVLFRAAGLDARVEPPDGPVLTTGEEGVRVVGHGHDLSVRTKPGQCYWALGRAAARGAATVAEHEDSKGHEEPLIFALYELPAPQFEVVQCIWKHARSNCWNKNIHYFEVWNECFYKYFFKTENF